MEASDLVLAIAVPLVTGLAGLAGVEMSLIIPLGPEDKRRRNYRAVLVALAVVAIVLNIWQTARNSQQQNEAKAKFQSNQLSLTNTISGQDGKLDAIVQLITSLLPRLQASSGPTDTAAKAYEAMAQAVIRLAQSGPPPKPPDDAASKEVWALTTAFQVAQQLRERSQDPFTLKTKLDDLSKREWEAETHCGQQHPEDPNCIKNVNKWWRGENQKAEDIYSPEAIQRLISSADSIRQILLQRIPREQQNPQDAAQAQKFTAALSNPDALDKADAASYLERLTRRVPTPTMPPSSK